MPPRASMPRDGFILIPRSAIQMIEVENSAYSPSSLGSALTRLEICDVVAPGDVQTQVMGGLSVYPWPANDDTPEPAPRNEDDILGVKKELREARKRIRELELENKAREEEVKDYEGEIEVLRAKVDEKPKLAEGGYITVGLDPGVIERRVASAIKLADNISVSATPTVNTNSLKHLTSLYDQDYFKKQLLGDWVS